MNEAGRRVVVMDPELLTEIFTAGYESGGIRCIEGLPPGAKYVRAISDENNISIVFEHPDWPCTNDDLMMVITPVMEALK